MHFSMKSRRKLLMVSLCLLMALVPMAEAAYATLRPGAQGAQVLTMQVALRGLGYSLNADGKYGPATAAAVTAFQASRGLRQDGLAGNQTLSALYAMSGSNPPAAATIPPATNSYPIGEGGVPEGTVAPSAPATNSRYALGSYDTGVATLQVRLNALGYPCGRTDGVYDAATRTAVINFQRTNGLSADGIAGNQTLQRLHSAQAIAATGGARATVPPATETPATPQQTPAPVMGRYTLGSFDAGITSLQMRLNSLGYPCGRTDGVYDAATRTAVINFQRANTLAADGIAGTQTLTRLYSAQAVAAGSQATPIPGGNAPIIVGGAALNAVVATSNGGSLRLRSSMGTSAGNVLGTLANGTALLVLNQVGEWAQVNASGRQGYVMKKFLSISGGTAVPTPVPGLPGNTIAPPIATPAAPTYLSGAKGSAVVQTGNGRPVNYRTSAANLGNANYAGQIANGDTVEVLSYGPTWCQISYRGRTGYVMTTFLRFTQLAGGATPAPSLAPTVSPLPTDLPSDVPAASPTPPPQDASLFTRILRPGDTGEDVSLLQSRLSALDYVVNENGVFDDTTAAAVRTFQSLNALTVDGKVGSQTAQALMSAGARRADSKPLTYKTLRMGDKDVEGVTAIKDMQQALIGLGFSLTADGSYGTQTHDAVVGFQQANGLTISGIADAQMQSVLFAGGAKGADQAGGGVDLSSGRIGAPGNVQLLHWYDEVKPQISGGQTTQVYHPASGVTFNIQYYSLGRHADSEPKTLKDTQLMNGAFGKASWNVRIVYVKMPSGVWTMAAMHNYPHLYGSIGNNGFGGHLCIHFLRDLDETQRTDPNYGMTNQKAIRSAWERLTGKVVE